MKNVPKQHELLLTFVETVTNSSVKCAPLCTANGKTCHTTKWSASNRYIQSNVKQLIPTKKVTLYCSLHKGKELELYCETCHSEEFICLHCTVNKHFRPQHKYDLMGDTFEKHEAESKIKASLKPVGELHSSTINVLEQLTV